MARVETLSVLPFLKLQYRVATAAAKIHTPMLISQHVTHSAVAIDPTTPTAIATTHNGATVLYRAEYRVGSVLRSATFFAVPCIISCDEKDLCSSSRAFTGQARKDIFIANQ